MSDSESYEEVELHDLSVVLSHCFTCKQKTWMEIESLKASKQRKYASCICSGCGKKGTRQISGAYYDSLKEDEYIELVPTALPKPQKKK